MWIEVSGDRDGDPFTGGGDFLILHGTDHLDRGDIFDPDALNAAASDFVF